jgi:hypothetical protein
MGALKDAVSTVVTVNSWVIDAIDSSSGSVVEPTLSGAEYEGDELDVVSGTNDPDDITPSGRVPLDSVAKPSEVAPIVVTSVRSEFLAGSVL